MKLKDKRTFIDSVKNCIEGFVYVISHERNFVIEIIIGILVIIAAFIFKISNLEWIIVLLLICFVLVLELINTAIEKLVDLYTTEYNELAKIIKDVSASVVLLVCIFSSIIGLIIFLPKIKSIAIRKLTLDFSIGILLNVKNWETENEGSSDSFLAADLYAAFVPFNKILDDGKT